jgi:hypothetical protein
MGSFRNCVTATVERIVVKKRSGKARLLASFDVDPAEGEFGIGLVGGTLYNINEIGTLLEKITLEWVHAAQREERDEDGNPIAPRWVKNNPDVSEFYHSLGFGVDPSEVDSASDEEVLDKLNQNDWNDWAVFAKDLIEALTSESGWDGTETEEQIDVPLRSTRITDWWGKDPESISLALLKSLRQILASADESPDP